MSFLHIIAYAATVLAFCFVVLSLACGLYYLAELVEEYTVYTRKVIKGMTVTVVSIHVLLWAVDRLPFLLLAFSIFCHGVYTMNLKTFPFISLTSPPFIASCVLVFVDHFLWFKFFTTHYRPFMDIAAFFGICVWLIPFTYFISLSANDNALPMTGESNNNNTATVDAIPSHQKKGLLRSMLSIFERKNNDVLPTTPYVPPTHAPTYDQMGGVPTSSTSPPPGAPITNIPTNQTWSSASYRDTSNTSSIQHRKVM
ncbi:transmembrane adaptor Erv26-domain-containing protein [Phascolomyces articulosus]|uniref:Transmembrane adaptor Erv26-domain-containing protein n=1 Tax=Phascolomyces articulosus TaxID=60185 RepID=A0AAD5K4L5_9FUNG|nr:transmembrane adaptor Erv26-domain-containing protein [Phascolomyces articulosus]